MYIYIRQFTMKTTSSPFQFPENTMLRGSGTGECCYLSLMPPVCSGWPIPSHFPVSGQEKIFKMLFALPPFYKQLQWEHMGQSFQDTISQIPPVAGTRGIVFCLPSLWDSSFCASMDGSCSENQDTQNAPTYSGCWPPPGGKTPKLLSTLC